MSDKPVNYTPEQTTDLVNQYKAGTSLEQLSESFGKSVRSIVAKLSREGVYEPKSRATGTQRVTKQDMVTEIAQWLDREHFEVVSLEKASHEVLSLLVEKIRA